MDYNRTYVELKCGKLRVYPTAATYYNRTYVELKQEREANGGETNADYNRTYVELKLSKEKEQEQAQQIIIVLMQN